MEVLLAHGADPNLEHPRMGTPLASACRSLADAHPDWHRDMTRTIELLLSHGADPDEKGCLVDAVRMYGAGHDQYKPVIALLVRAGAAVKPVRKFVESYFRDNPRRATMLRLLGSRA